MKTGIMTWFTYHNYGTALQVTALTEKIRSLKHEAVVINYDPMPKQIQYQTRRAKIKREGLIKFVVFRVWRRLKNFVLRRNYTGYSSAERENRFNEFLSENISITGKCNTPEELAKAAESLDAVVCGSDQIWSPLCFDSHYYLDFVRDRAKKLAYAPSIDTNHVRNDKVKKQIIDLAGDFEFISVREKKSAEILSQWLNKNVKAVLDPALLLKADEWEKHIPDHISKYTHGGGGALCGLHAWPK